MICLRGFSDEEKEGFITLTVGCVSDAITIMTDKGNIHDETMPEIQERKVDLRFFPAKTISRRVVNYLGRSFYHQ